jgi:hypothetical protein
MTVPTSKFDLFKRIIDTYSARAQNKSLHTRVWHSSAMDAARRTVDAGKMHGVAAGARAGVSKIGAPLAMTAASAAAKRAPVPVVPEILAILMGDLESWARDHQLKRNLQKVAGNLDGEEKFNWKQVSFSSLDSYRQKLDKAVHDFKQQADAYKRNKDSIDQSGAVCDGYAGVLDAMFHMHHRSEKLLDMAVEMQSLSSAIIERIGRIPESFSSSNLEDSIIDGLYASMQDPSAHAGCSHCLRNGVPALSTNRRVAQRVSGNKFFSAVMGHAVDQAKSMGNDQISSLAETGAPKIG